MSRKALWILKKYHKWKRSEKQTPEKGIHEIKDDFCIEATESFNSLTEYKNTEKAVEDAAEVWMESFTGIAKEEVGKTSVDFENGFMMITEELKTGCNQANLGELAEESIGVTLVGDGNCDSSNEIDSGGDVQIQPIGEAANDSKCFFGHSIHVPVNLYPLTDGDAPFAYGKDGCQDSSCISEYDKTELGIHSPANIILEEIQNNVYCNQSEETTPQRLDCMYHCDGDGNYKQECRKGTNFKINSKLDLKQLHSGADSLNSDDQSTRDLNHLQSQKNEMRKSFRHDILENLLQTIQCILNSNIYQDNYEKRKCDENTTGELDGFRKTDVEAGDNHQFGNSAVLEHEKISLINNLLITIKCILGITDESDYDYKKDDNKNIYEFEEAIRSQLSAFAENFQSSSVQLCRPVSKEITEVFSSPNTDKEVGNEKSINTGSESENSNSESKILRLENIFNNICNSVFASQEILNDSLMGQCSNGTQANNKCSIVEMNSFVDWNHVFSADFKSKIMSFLFPSPSDEETLKSKIYFHSQLEARSNNLPNITFGDTQDRTESDNTKEILRLTTSNTLLDEDYFTNGLIGGNNTLLVTQETSNGYDVQCFENSAEVEIYHDTDNHQLNENITQLTDSTPLPEETDTVIESSESKTTNNIDRTPKKDEYLAHIGDNPDYSTKICNVFFDENSIPYDCSDVLTLIGDQLFECDSIISDYPNNSNTGISADNAAEDLDKPCPYSDQNSSFYTVSECLDNARISIPALSNPSLENMEDYDSVSTGSQSPTTSPDFTQILQEEQEKLLLENHTYQLVSKKSDDETPNHEMNIRQPIEIHDRLVSINKAQARTLFLKQSDILKPQRNLSSSKIKTMFYVKFRSHSKISTGGSSWALITSKGNTAWLTEAGIIDKLLTAEQAHKAFKESAGKKVAITEYEYKTFLAKLSRQLKIPHLKLMERMGTFDLKF